MASPTTNPSGSSNTLTSLLHVITKKRSLSPTVQRFSKLCLQQQSSKSTDPSASSIQQEQTEKIIRNLIKKLSKAKRQGNIDELERAIVHKDSRTKCVTIPR